MWKPTSSFWPIIVAGLLAPPWASAQTESRYVPDPRTEEAIALMMDFAERTGLASGRSPQRYLWTDAFAVCNFLGLARATGEGKYTELALRLVDQVHRTLGRHRDDDPRNGWISGLSEQEGAAHPTRGGLRIGKKRPERGPGEPYDEALEWERDGQYFHYLTRWMHALDQVTRATGRARYNVWARELAETAHGAFGYQASGAYPRRMYWKMSIDLARPLVASMGHHDPLDGYITYLQLQSTAAGLPAALAKPDLGEAIRQSGKMIEGGAWETADPLGLGGLLMDAYRVEQLRRRGILPDDDLPETLLAASLTGMRHYARDGKVQQPAEYRLAFRELGLVIGLHAVSRMWEAAASAAETSAEDSRAGSILQALMQYVPLRDELESFWRDPRHRRTRTWSEHRDINDVMLATSLAPGGYLLLLPPGRSSGSE
jgi:hypothetical protein